MLAELLVINQLHQRPERLRTKREDVQKVKSMLITTTTFLGPPADTRTYHRDVNWLERGRMLELRTVGLRRGSFAVATHYISRDFC